MTGAEADEILVKLPAVPAEPVRPRIREITAVNGRTLVVLDDDPTGTQTVYDVPVLTQWDVASLMKELRGDHPCFYVLTNSRSLTPNATADLHRELSLNLEKAAAESGEAFTLVSRSDSTLRGHFPLETNILTETLGPFDATFVIPFFEAGGRVTLEDVHYVVEGNDYTPAAHTPFAKDAVFGYNNSNLREWVSEKTEGAVPAAEVESISLHDLRGSADAVTARLLNIPSGAYSIVNACEHRDVEAFALASLEAEQQGKRYLFRSAASFVAARIGLDPRPLWQPSSKDGNNHAGGLVVVGSYVPKTSAQLQCLLDSTEIEGVELDVSRLLSEDRPSLLNDSTERLREALRQGRNVVLYTSRELITGDNTDENLAIGKRVSDALVELVRRLDGEPRFLIAKGGITSSDIATHALGVKRAMVRGQIVPGVPVWQLGRETRFPGLPYVVFPGNVGSRDALADAVRMFADSNAFPTLDD